MDQTSTHQYSPAYWQHPPLLGGAPLPPHAHGPQDPRYVPHGFYPPSSYAWPPQAPHETAYNAHVPLRPTPVAHPVMHGGYTYHPRRPSVPATYPHGIAAEQPSARRQQVAPLHTSPLPTAARGPPCKPRQSGWAVWVGNLPADTTVIHLRDHFSTGARADIESVFLITKTNCAFVNYTTEQACLDAIRRFDCNLFRGHRLVCRMRHGSLENVPSTPSPSSSDVPSLSNSSSPDDSSSDRESESEQNSGAPLIVGTDYMGPQPSPPETKPDAASKMAAGLQTLSIQPKVKTRMFILKSLTLQDLLVSTRDGVWVTQPHNEQRLNEAFHTAQDVYLIFSANKSGQYFGCARMESAIGAVDSPQSAPPPPPPSAAPPTQNDAFKTQEGESPRKISMPATEIAPAGYIMDDSARGTIFWEAEREAATAAEPSSPAESKSDSGRQFRIRWIATTQVPFHATRGLRNPLNSNREVKIARDGTELGAHTGSRLLQLFHRPTSPVSPTSMWGS